MRMCHFQAKNDPFVLNKIFLVQTFIIFIYLLALFIAQNLKKILTGDPELWGCTIFGPKMVHWHKIFFGKLLISLSSTYLPLSLCKILKKLFLHVQSYEDAQFLGPKWSISLNENFFRKTIEPCSFHSCLSTCQKSKSDINLLVKYWRLKNTEISLAKSHFWL